MKQILIIAALVTMIASCAKSQQQQFEDLAVQQIDSIFEGKRYEYHPESFSDFYVVFSDGSSSPNVKLKNIIGEDKTMELAMKMLQFLEDKGDVQELLEDAKSIDATLTAAKVIPGAYYAVHKCKVKDTETGMSASVKMGVVIFPEGTSFRKTIKRPMTVITDR